MEEKDWTQILADFSATKEAKPNLTQDEWFEKFPEFGNDKNLLQAAYDYDATVKSGKYKDDQATLQSKFPEFGGSKATTTQPQPTEQPQATEQPAQPVQPTTTPETTPYLSMTPMAVEEMPEQYRAKYATLSEAEQLVFSKALAKQQQMATPEGRSKAARDMRTVAGNLPRRDPRRKQLQSKAQALEDYNTNGLYNAEQMEDINERAKDNKATAKEDIQAARERADRPSASAQTYNTASAKRQQQEQNERIDGMAVAMGINTDFKTGTQVFDAARRMYDKTDDGKAMKQRLNDAIETDAIGFYKAMANSEDAELKEAAQLMQDMESIGQESRELTALVEQMNERYTSLNGKATAEEAAAYNAESKALDKRLADFEAKRSRYVKLQEAGAFDRLNEALNEYLKADNSYTNELSREYYSKMEAMFGGWIDSKELPIKRDVVKERLDLLSGEINKAITEKNKKFYGGESGLSPTMALIATSNPFGTSDAVMTSASPAAGNLSVARAYANKIQKLTENDRSGIYANSIAKGFVDDAASMDFWTFGLNSVVEGLTVKDISDELQQAGVASLNEKERATYEAVLKKKTNELTEDDMEVFAKVKDEGYKTLSDDEKLAYDAYELYGQSMELFKPSNWYTAGVVTAEAIPFIFAMGGSGRVATGIGKQLGKSSSKFVRTIGKAFPEVEGRTALRQLAREGEKVTAKQLGKNALKATGRMATEGFVYAGTTGLPQVAASAIDYMMPQLQTEVNTETRDIDTKVIKPSDDSWGEALGKGFALQAIEGGSEALSTHILEPGARALGAKIMGGIHKNGERYFTNIARSFFKTMGAEGSMATRHLSGPVFEYVEELFGGFMRCMTGLSEWDEEFSGKNLAETAFGLMPMEVLFMGIGGGSMAAHRKRMRQAQNFLNEFSPESQSLYDRLSGMSTYEGQDLLDREMLNIMQEVDKLKAAGKFDADAQKVMAARMNAALTAKEQLYMDEFAATIKEEQRRNTFEFATSNLNQDNGNLVVAQYTNDNGDTQQVYVISQDGDTMTVSDGTKRFSVDAEQVEVTNEYNQEEIEDTIVGGEMEGDAYTIAPNAPAPVAGQQYLDEDGQPLVFEGGSTLTVDEVDEDGYVTFTYNGRQQTASRREFNEIVQASRNYYQKMKDDVESFDEMGRGHSRAVANTNGVERHANAGRGMRDARAVLAEHFGEGKVQEMEEMWNHELARVYATSNKFEKMLIRNWLQHNGTNNVYYGEMAKRRQALLDEANNTIGRFMQQGEQQRLDQYNNNGIVEVADLDGQQVIIGKDDGQQAIVMDANGNAQIVATSQLGARGIQYANNIAATKVAPKTNALHSLEEQYEGLTARPNTEYVMGVKEDGTEEKVAVVGFNNGNVVYATAYGFNDDGSIKPDNRSINETDPYTFRDMVENADRKRQQQQVQKEVQQQANADQGNYVNDQDVRVKVGDKIRTGKYVNNVGHHFVVFNDNGNTEIKEFASIDDIKQAERDALMADGVTTEAAAEQIIAQRQAELQAIAAMEQEYQQRFEEAETKEDKAKVIQEYLDQIKTDDYVMITRDNFEEYLKGKVSPRELRNIRRGFRITGRNGQKVRGFYANGIIFINSDDITSIKDARTAYIHERQHGITKNNLSLRDAIIASAAKYDLDRYVAALSRSPFYQGQSQDAVAEEFISMAMEVAYTNADVEAALRELGIDNDILIKTIIQLDNEQRANASLSKARGNALLNESRQRDDRNDGNDTQGRPADVGGQGTGLAGGSVQEGGRDKGESVTQQQQEQPQPKTREQRIADEVAFVMQPGNAKFLDDRLKDAKKKKKAADNLKPSGETHEAYEASKASIKEKQDAAEDELKFWQEVNSAVNEARLADQTRLNEADQALQDLDKNLVPTVEAEEVHKFDKEPANADEAAADFLVGFVKKEHRINEQSLMQETGWSEDEVKNFRPATTPDGGMTLQEAAENLYNEYESEWSEHGWFKDPSEARDKLISVMQEAGKYGELANYINQRRGNDAATQQMQAALDYNAQQLGYADAQDMHDKRMAEAQAKLEELKDEQGNLSEEALQQFKDFTQGLMIWQEETPAEQPTESIEGEGEYYQPTNEEPPFSVVLPIDQQTPKNTTIDQVLYSIKVNHNSLYLLKRADGSFIDPETGERLGFDHRFMNTGEGAQAHGWGSYFSVNDLRRYAKPEEGRFTYKGLTWKQLWNNHSDDNDYNAALKVLDNMALGMDAEEAIKQHKKDILSSYKYFKAEDGVRGTHYADGYAKILKDIENFNPKDFAETDRQRHHYDVEIPDNDGTNYIEESGAVSNETKDRVYNELEQEAKKNDLLDLGLDKRDTFNSFVDNGYHLYSAVTRYMGGMEDASKFLNSIGFTGIHYDGQRDGECYVIFDENDAKIVDHVMFSVTGLITNEQGEIDYDRVTNLAENITNDGASMGGLGVQEPNGRATSRLPRIYQSTSGMSAAAAEIIARASYQKIGGERSAEGRMAQTPQAVSFRADTRKAIESWAKDQGYWYDEPRLTDGYTEIEGGTESRVFVNADKTKVRKLTSYTAAYGDYMQRLMENVEIFNATFPDAAYEVIGFGQDNNGNLAAVVEQPYIEGEKVSDIFRGWDDQFGYISNAMSRLGFRPIDNDGTYTNGTAYASDINADNMVVDGEGNPHIIDAVMSLRPEQYSEPFVLYSVVSRIPSGLRQENESVPAIAAQAIAKGLFASKLARLGKTQGSAAQRNEGATGRGDSERVPELEGQDLRFSFIGRQGAQRLDLKERAMTRLNNLHVARQMEEQGKDANAVKMATGWERGKDGKWRYEIPEASMDEIVKRMREPILPKIAEIKRLKELARRDYEKFEYLDNNIPARLDSRFTEEEKQTYREQRKERDRLLQSSHANKTDAEVIEGELRNDGVEMTLGEILPEDNELLKAYPQLANIKVRYYNRETLRDGSYGRYNDKQKTLFVAGGRPVTEIYSTLYHEIQHAIQDIEGFAHGGNPQTAAQAVKDMDNNAKIWGYKMMLDEVAKQHPEHADSEYDLLWDVLLDYLGYENDGQAEYNARHDGWIPDENLRKQAFKIFKGRISGDTYEKAYNKWFDKLRESGNPNYFESTPFQLYKRLAGETEARNVQSRLGLTYEERRQMLAAETEDVAREDQLVMFAGDPVLYSVTAAQNGTPSLREITTQHLLQLAADNKNDMRLREDAIRAFNDRLTEIMKEMRSLRKGKLSKRTQRQTERAVEGVANTQQQYDQTITDKVTRLATMFMRYMNLNDLTRGEVSRLFSAVKNSATGSVSEQATKIIDIMLDHQLRDAEALVQRQLNTKASTTNQSGVRVQGALDAQGQRILEAAKEGIAMDYDEWIQRLQDVQDKMSSPSGVTQQNAALDYEGLMLAQQYRWQIASSEQEQKNLERDLRERQELIYDFVEVEKDGKKRIAKRLKPEFKGKLDKQHQAIKDSVLQTEVETEENIRTLKMERAEAYARMSQALGSVIEQGREAAKAFREREQQRVSEIQHNANSDLNGVSASEFHELSPWERFKGTAFSWMFAPQRNFDEMLRFLAPKSADGKGYLFKRFMTQYQQAMSSEWSNLMMDNERLDAKVNDLFGKKNMKWEDLYSMERKMPTITVEWLEENENGEYELKEHEITQGNALYIYMVNKMDDGAVKLRAMGISEDKVDDIVGQLNPQFVELADWIQEEFLPQARDRYNEVHLRMFDAPMAAIENYFPLRILDRSRGKKEELGKEEGNNLPHTVTGAIIERKHNINAIDLLHSDAFSVVVSHIQEMEHWASFAELSRDLSTLLSYKRFRNRLSNMSSARFGVGTKYSQGKAQHPLFDRFKKTCNIVCGTYKPSTSELDKTVLNIAKGVTASKINFRLYTAFKQITSTPAFWADASIVEIAKSGFNPASPFLAWNWAIKELPGFAKRWQSRYAGNEMLDDTESDWAYWRNGFVKSASRLGMSPNAFVDAITVAMGSKAVYETKFKQYKKQGFDDAKAKEKALNDAWLTYNESQQSNDKAFLSIMQSDRTFVNSMLSLFRNASFGYGRRLTRATANLKKLGNKDDIVDYLTKQGVREGLTEVQAKKAAEKAYNKIFIKSIWDMTVFGFIVQFAWNLAPYLPYLIGGDDDDLKKDYLSNAAYHSLAGGVEGMPGGNIVSSVYNDILTGGDWTSYNYHIAPLLSDLDNIKKKFGNDKLAAANDMMMILISSLSGIDPRGITDIGAAVMDACNGDPETSIEAALLIMRIAEVPQSQLDQLYIDEVGLTAGEAKQLNAEDLARRYAAYKMHRNAPLTSWAYDDEQRDKAMERGTKRFYKLLSDRIGKMGDESLEQTFNEIEDNGIKNMVGKAVATKMGGTDDEGKNPSSGWKPETQKAHITYQTKRTYNDMKEDVALRKATKKAKEEGDMELAKQLEKQHRELQEIKHKLGRGNDDKVMNQLRERRRKVLEVYNIKVE